VDQVLPIVLEVNNTRENIPNIAITNSGAYGSAFTPDFISSTPPADANDDD
jgi:hypothetical protein